MIKPELLAPAGDLEKLKIALLYGADSVYIGGKSFSLRARASNFDLSEIEKAVNFAHRLNKKVYVTVNSILHDEDLPGLIDYLKALETINVDAIIVASTSVVSIALEHTHLEVHISTQQSITNSSAINYWIDQGVQRVVLARELSLHEIGLIRKNTTADLEVFIHGGMCASYSGKCTLSNNLTDRDANRGGCAHSCRWDYHLYEGDTKIDSKVPFSMSSKDLQVLEHLPRLIDIGINSLKIEGRMKSVHYIATVVKAYRQTIDAYYANHTIDIKPYEDAIKKAENRLTNDGFLRGNPTEDHQLYNLRSEQPTQEFVAMVLDYNAKTKVVTLEQRNYFTTSDTLELFSPDCESHTFKVSELRDDQGEFIDIARHPKQRLEMPTPIPMKPFDILRKVTIDNG